MEWPWPLQPLRLLQPWCVVIRCCKMMAKRKGRDCWCKQSSKLWSQLLFALNFLILAMCSDYTTLGPSNSINSGTVSIAECTWTRRYHHTCIKCHSWLWLTIILCMLMLSEIVAYTDRLVAWQQYRNNTGSPSPASLGKWKSKLPPWSVPLNNLDNL